VISDIDVAVDICLNTKEKYRKSNSDLFDLIPPQSNSMFGPITFPEITHSTPGFLVLEHDMNNMRVQD
tara:strand:- start:194 stop:397 length:204 start_codon:yes stop_codon:yes gene_type:complete